VHYISLCTKLNLPAMKNSLPYMSSERRQFSASTYSRGWTVKGLSIHLVALALSLLTLTLNTRVWGQCTTSPCGFTGGTSSRDGTTGTITSNNTQTTWTVPCGVSSVTIKCWGGGGGSGGSGSGDGSKAGSGGGGGGYSQSTLSVNPGDVLYIQVGDGGVRGSASNSPCATCSNGGSGGISYVKTGSHSGSTICLANGGSGGRGSSNGTSGGSGANTTGAVSNAGTARLGGNGGSGSTSAARAGGGGGSGGPSGNGGNAASGCGGCGGTGTGGSGNGGYAGATATSCASACGNYAGVSPTNYNYGAGAAGGARISSQQNGANGHAGYVEISFTTSSSSVAPTSISGTSTICNGSSTTLTTNGGSLGTDANDIWYSGSVCPSEAYTQEWAGSSLGFTSSNTTFNSASGGILNLTSTSNDPMIEMYSLGSFSPSTFRYINVRYRVTSATAAGSMQIFWTNSTHSSANGAQYKDQPISSTQNVWQTVSIDMGSPTAGTWTSSNVTGWRFDWATASGVTMEIDFITLSSHPIIGEGSSITVSPTSTTTYYTQKKGACNSTACASAAVTVNTVPSAPTATNGSRCGTGTVAISGTPGAGETIDWYGATSGGSILTTGSPNPAQGTTSFTTPSISATTTYYAQARNSTTGCVSSTRTAVTATVNALATAGTFQYANGSTQSICAGSSISCSNVSSPTNGGNGTLSVVWYCGERTGVGTYDYGNWKESTLANVSFTTSSTNLNTAAGGGSGMSHALTNYNPQADFPGKTDFWIIRRAYTDLCGVGVNDSYVDQSFFLTVNATNTSTLTSAIGTNSQTKCINSAITNITYSTTGATGIGTATGLPTGISAGWSGGTITISGTPTSSGTYNYSIPLTGGCGSVSATGTITVDAPTLPPGSISPVNGDYVWQGTLSTAWGTAGNWLMYNGTNYVSAGSAPDNASLRTFVPDYTGGCTTYDPTIAGSVSTDNLTITTGAKVTIPASSTLTISGNLSNNGTLESSGTINIEGSWVNNGTFTSNTGNTVVFNGSSASNYVSGSNTFNNLTIAGSSSSLQVSLQSDATVLGTLTMTSGNLILDITSSNRTLTVGSSSATGSISSGSSTSYIVAYDNGTRLGKVKRFVNSTPSTSYSFPIGDATSYTPLTYTNVSGTVASGAYLEVYTKSVKIPQLNSTLTNYINRYWEVTPSDITSPNYNITYTYDNGDVVGNQTSFVPIKYSSGTWYKPSNSVFTTGTAQGTASGPTNNTVTWSSLTSFSQFSVAGNTGSALPVELTTFQANCSDNKTVDVTWTTASEHNTNYFRVDKSRNGTQWDVLGTIGAAGNSTNLIDYALKDYFPNAGINYYRLTQYDLDGVFETFDAQAAVCSEQQAGTALSTYPNPSSSDFNVDLQSDEMEGEGVLLVTDAKGAVVYSQNIKIINGTNNYVIQRFEAAPGIYYISVKSGANSVTTKHSLR
jgi:hypothetical protein